MGEEKDIRWAQRLDSFKKAFARLDMAVRLSMERPLSELEGQGLIQAFEFTHELAWKTLKDFLEAQGRQPIYGSKDATRLAFQLGLIEDGQAWMDMVKSRNLSSHTYDEATAQAVIDEVTGRYHGLFGRLIERLEGQLPEQR